MNQFVENVRYNFSEKLILLSIFLVRMISGLLISLTVALSVQEALDIGMFSFMFIVISLTGITLRLTQRANMLSAIIFLLVLVLIGVLLKLYIQSAL